jgi:hypothetical protein
VDPIAVPQTRLGALQIDMPDAVGLFGNRDSAGLQIVIAIIVKTELYASRVFAEKRKVYARPIPVRPLWVRVAGHRSDCAIHRTEAFLSAWKFCGCAINPAYPAISKSKATKCGANSAVF